MKTLYVQFCLEQERVMGKSKGTMEKYRSARNSRRSGITSIATRQKKREASTEDRSHPKTR